MLTWLARRTHYVSTYCIHREHSACRLTCKTCAKWCRCRCHREPRSRLWVAGAVAVATALSMVVPLVIGWLFG